MQNEFIAPELQRAKLNLETALAPWSALERFFAQGRLIWVDEKLDLLDVAFAVSQDEVQTIDDWMQVSGIRQPCVEQAKRWQSNDQPLWAVVVRPWVFIQEDRAGESTTPP